MAALAFAFGIVLPNVLIMAMGWALMRGGFIRQQFVDQAAFLVFYISLPCLLFMSILESSAHIAEQWRLLAAGCLVTVLLFVGAETYVRRFVSQVQDQGVFVQAVFRSNMAIIGLATIANAYGNAGLAVGAVYMGVITVLFNVLAVVTLSRTSPKPKPNAATTKLPSALGRLHGSKLLLLVKNPLILALLLAFAYKGLSLPDLPVAIADTLRLLAAIALPLALICAGATIKIKPMLKMSGLSMQASLVRVVVAPLIAIGVGYAFSLEPLSFGVLFLMVSAPTAAASYVMAKAMGGNAELAANVLAFTSVASMGSMALGAAALRAAGLM